MGSHENSRRRRTQDPRLCCRITKCRKNIVTRLRSRIVGQWPLSFLVFFGMLRFHVFEKLNVHSLGLVTLRGLEIKLKSIPPRKRRCLLFANDLLGFYFDVSDKFHPAGRVYLAKIADTTPAWKPFCPLRALRRLWVHGLLTQTTFDKHNLVGSEVVAAMRFVDGNTRDFQTQSLRIGGHTFLVAHSLPEDFVNFFGRRKIKKASQLYYRDSARLTLAFF